MSRSFIAEIDPAELAVRLMEVGIGLKRGGDRRPPTEILETSKKKWPKDAGPFPFGRMAVVAIEFFRECIEKGQITQ